MLRIDLDPPSARRGAEKAGTKKRLFAPNKETLKRVGQRSVMIQRPNALDISAAHNIVEAKAD